MEAAPGVNSLVLSLYFEATQFGAQVENTFKNFAQKATSAVNRVQDRFSNMWNDFTNKAEQAGKRVSLMFSRLSGGSFFSHLFQGMRDVFFGFERLVSFISKLKFLFTNLGKLIINVIKSPLTLLKTITSKIRGVMESLFKSFEWIQYQLFMQFMNFWLYSKIFFPLLETFKDYNKEVYNTSALIGDIWKDIYEDIKNARDVFEDFNNVTLSSLFSGEMEDYLTDLGLMVSKVFGKIPKDIAKAMYQLASATVPFERMPEFLITAAKAATAGVTSLENAAKAGIQAIFAFGGEMDNLTEVYEAQFLAVKYGILRYEDLVKVMGRVYQPAASLANTMNNLREAYATLAFATRVGLSPEMAAFGMARLYEAFSKPTVVASLEKLGVKVYSLMGDFRGLAEIVKDLSGRLVGFSTRTQQMMLSNLGFDMRAIRVLRSLINNYTSYADLLEQYHSDLRTNMKETSQGAKQTANTYQEALSNVANTTKSKLTAMDEAFNKFTESMAFKLDQLSAAWESFKISITEAISPVLSFAIEGLSKFLGYIVDLFERGSFQLGDFNFQIGSLAKSVTVFYLLYSVTAMLSGSLASLMTPLGIVLFSFVKLTKEAMTVSDTFLAFTSRFQLLGQVFYVIGQYVNFFLSLLQTGEAPVSAFLKLLQFAFRDLYSVFSQNKSIRAFVQTLKDIWNVLKSIFNPAEMKKLLQAAGFDSLINYIAYKFGLLINNLGQIMKDIFSSLFGIESAENWGLIDFLNALADIFEKFFKNLFAGLFNVSPEEMGIDEFLSKITDLLLKAASGFESGLIGRFINYVSSALGAVLKNSLKLLIPDIGSSLILPIAGFSITKTVLKNLMAKMMAGLAAVSSGAFSITSMGFKLTAMIFFTDFIFGKGISNSFSKLALTLVGSILAMSIGKLIFSKIGEILVKSKSSIAKTIMTFISGMFGKTKKTIKPYTMKANTVIIFAENASLISSGTRGFRSTNLMKGFLKAVKQSLGLETATGTASAASAATSTATAAKGIVSKGALIALVIGAAGALVAGLFLGREKETKAPLVNPLAEQAKTYSYVSPSAAFEGSLSSAYKDLNNFSSTLYGNTKVLRESFEDTSKYLYQLNSSASLTSRTLEDITNKEKEKSKWIDWLLTASGIGLVAGGILMASGIGAPAGAAIAATSAGVAGATGGISVSAIGGLFTGASIGLMALSYERKKTLQAQDEDLLRQIEDYRESYKDFYRNFKYRLVRAFESQSEYKAQFYSYIIESYKELSNTEQDQELVDNLIDFSKLSFTYAFLTKKAKPAFVAGKEFAISKTEYTDFLNNYVTKAMKYFAPTRAESIEESLKGETGLIKTLFNKGILNDFNLHYTNLIANLVKTLYTYSSSVLGVSLVNREGEFLYEKASDLKVTLEGFINQLKSEETKLKNRGAEEEAKEIGTYINKLEAYGNLIYSDIGKNIEDVTVGRLMSLSDDILSIIGRFRPKDIKYKVDKDFLDALENKINQFSYDQQDIIYSYLVQAINTYEEARINAKKTGGKVDITLEQALDKAYNDITNLAENYGLFSSTFLSISKQINLHKIANDLIASYLTPLFEDIKASAFEGTDLGDLINKYYEEFDIAEENRNLTSLMDTILEKLSGARTLKETIAPLEALNEISLRMTNFVGDNISDLEDLMKFLKTQEEINIAYKASTGEITTETANILSAINKFRVFSDVGVAEYNAIKDELKLKMNKFEEEIKKAGGKTVELIEKYSNEVSDLLLRKMPNTMRLFAERIFADASASIIRSFVSDIATKPLEISGITYFNPRTGVAFEGLFEIEDSFRKGIETIARDWGADIQQAFITAGGEVSDMLKDTIESRLKEIIGAKQYEFAGATIRNTIIKMLQENEAFNNITYLTDILWQYRDVIDTETRKSIEDIGAAVYKLEEAMQETDFASIFRGLFNTSDKFKAVLDRITLYGESAVDALISFVSKLSQELENAKSSLVTSIGSFDVSGMMLDQSILQRSFYEMLKNNEYVEGKSAKQFLSENIDKTTLFSLFRMTINSTFDVVLDLNDEIMNIISEETAIQLKKQEEIKESNLNTLNTLNEKVKTTQTEYTNYMNKALSITAPKVEETGAAAKTTISVPELPPLPELPEGLSAEKIQENINNISSGLLSLQEIGEEVDLTIAEREAEMGITDRTISLVKSKVREHVNLVSSLMGLSVSINSILTEADYKGIASRVLNAEDRVNQMKQELNSIDVKIFNEWASSMDGLAAIYEKVYEAGYAGVIDSILAIKATNYKVEQIKEKYLNELAKNEDVLERSLLGGYDVEEFYSKYYDLVVEKYGSWGEVPYYLKDLVNTLATAKSDFANAKTLEETQAIATIMKVLGDFIANIAGAVEGTDKTLGGETSKIVSIMESYFDSVYNFFISVGESLNTFIIGLRGHLRSPLSMQQIVDKDAFNSFFAKAFQAAFAEVSGGKLIKSNVPLLKKVFSIESTEQTLGNLDQIYEQLYYFNEILFKERKDLSAEDKKIADAFQDFINKYGRYGELDKSKIDDFFLELSTILGSKLDSFLEFLRKGKVDVEKSIDITFEEDYSSLLDEIKQKAELQSYIDVFNFVLPIQDIQNSLADIVLYSYEKTAGEVQKVIDNIKIETTVGSKNKIYKKLIYEGDELEGDVLEAFQEWFVKNQLLFETIPEIAKIYEDGIVTIDEVIDSLFYLVDRSEDIKKLGFDVKDIDNVAYDIEKQIKYIRKAGVFTEADFAPLKDKYNTTFNIIKATKKDVRTWAINIASNITKWVVSQLFMLSDISADINSATKETNTGYVYSLSDKLDKQMDTFLRLRTVAFNEITEAFLQGENLQFNKRTSESLKVMEAKVTRITEAVWEGFGEGKKIEFTHETKSLFNVLKTHIKESEIVKKASVYAYSVIEDSIKTLTFTDFFKKRLTSESIISNLLVKIGVKKGSLFDFLSGVLRPLGDLTSTAVYSALDKINNYFTEKLYSGIEEALLSQAVKVTKEQIDKGVPKEQTVLGDLASFEKTAAFIFSIAGDVLSGLIRMAFAPDDFFKDLSFEKVMPQTSKLLGSFTEEEKEQFIAYSTKLINSTKVSNLYSDLMASLGGKSKDLYNKEEFKNIFDSFLDWVSEITNIPSWIVHLVGGFLGNVLSKLLEKPEYRENAKIFITRIFEASQGRVEDAKNAIDNHIENLNNDLINYLSNMEENSIAPFIVELRSLYKDTIQGKTINTDKINKLFDRYKDKIKKVEGELEFELPFMQAGIINSNNLIYTEEALKKITNLINDKINKTNEGLDMFIGHAYEYKDSSKRILAAKVKKVRYDAEKKIVYATIKPIKENYETLETLIKSEKIKGLSIDYKYLKNTVDKKTTEVETIIAENILDVVSIDFVENPAFDVAKFSFEKFEGTLTPEMEKARQSVIDVGLMLWGLAKLNIDYINDSLLDLINNTNIEEFKVPEGFSFNQVLENTLDYYKYKFGDITEKANLPSEFFNLDTLLALRDYPLDSIGSFYTSLYEEAQADANKKVEEIKKSEAGKFITDEAKFKQMLTEITYVDKALSDKTIERTLNAINAMLEVQKEFKKIGITLPLEDKNKMAQILGVSVEDYEKLSEQGLVSKKLMEIKQKFIEGIWQDIQTTGQVFSSLAETLDRAAKENLFGVGEDVYNAVSKLVSGLGAIISFAEDIRTGIYMQKVGKEYKNNENALMQLAGVAMIFGGYASIIGGIVQLFLTLKTTFEQTSKISEAQIIAIQNNTNAIKALVDVMRNISVTVENAPGAFAYGYTLPSIPSTTSVYQAPLRTTQINNGSSSQVFNVNIAVNGSALEATDIKQAVIEGLKQGIRQSR